MNNTSADPAIILGVCRWFVYKRFSINALQKDFPQASVNLFQDPARFGTTLVAGD